MPPPPPPSATGTVGADVPPASGRGGVGGQWGLTWGRLRCEKGCVLCGWVAGRRRVSYQPRLQTLPCPILCSSLGSNPAGRNKLRVVSF